jgi:Xaa-Pro dipeptidase
LRYTPKAELDSRVAKLQACLQQDGIDGAIIVQNADLFYFSGTIQRSHLFIPAEGKPVLMVKKNLERAKTESRLDNIVGVGSLREMGNILQSFGYGPFKTLGFELDVLPANNYLRYQKLFTPAKIVDVSMFIRMIRAVKSPYEMEILRDVAILHQETFYFVKDNLREGLNELELSAMIAAFSRQKGHSGFMRVRAFNEDLFYVHLLSGDNTDPTYLDGPVGGRGVGPAFAQGSCDKIIGKNEPMLFDFDFIYDGYMLDQSRVFCLGKLPDHLVQAHGVALEIQAELEGMARPGTICHELYDRAVAMAKESPFEKHFQGFPDHVPFVGHGIGIELDEFPVIGRGFTNSLEEGMVFALEPKFVFSDGAVGVEDTYVVTKDGLEKLTVFEDGIIYV